VIAKSFMIKKNYTDHLCRVKKDIIIKLSTIFMISYCILIHYKTNLIMIILMLNNIIFFFYIIITYSNCYVNNLLSLKNVVHITVKEC
jgi:hypothetical protein